jgi:alpha-tubulin suppressor-like RCC1 family protein
MRHLDTVENGRRPDRARRVRRLALFLWAVVLSICCLAAAGAVSASAEANAVLNWGINPSGSLALGWESQIEPSPQTVAGLSEAASVAGGWHDGYALMSNGTVQAWGGNGYGQLGDGTREDKTQPVAVNKLHNVIAISIAGYHAMALSEGKVWTWGIGQSGQRGDGTSGLEECGPGEGHKCCEEGTWRCEPTEVPELANVVAVGSGGGSDFAIVEEGGTTKLMAWGSDKGGRLGIGGASTKCETEVGKIPCATKPVEVKFTGLGEGVHPVQVSSGMASDTEVGSAYALMSDGSVWAWGANGHGGLGNGTTTASNVPIKVHMERVEHEEAVKTGEVSAVASLSGGSGYVLARLSNGRVIGWGSNTIGQLGPSTSEECSEHPTMCECTGTNSECSKLPMLLGGLGETTPISELAVGGSFNLALGGGKVYAWGRNSPDGQLGIGDEIGPEECGKESNGFGEPVLPLLCAHTPTLIPHLEGVKSIGAGFTGGLTIVPSEPVPTPAIALVPGHTELTVRWTFPLAGINPHFKIRYRTWAPNPEERGPLSPKKEVLTSCSEAIPCEVTLPELEKRPYEVVVTSEAETVAGSGTFKALNSRQIVGTPLAPNLTVAGVSPSSGPAAGGNVVSITGTNFEAGATVKFGEASATGVSVNSTTSITATAPPGAGTVDVKVTEAAGKSEINPADHYIYIPAPKVKKLEPSSGASTGGQTVTITGTEFTGATSVKFGSTNAVEYTVESSTTIVAKAPALPVGTVDVTVTTAGGTSEIASVDKYKSMPIVLSITPTSGPAAGGSSVTVTGSGFVTGTTATTFKFGTTKAKTVSCSSSTTCVVTSPAHATAPVDVVATVEKVESPLSEADQFTYV